MGWARIAGPVLAGLLHFVLCRNFTGTRNKVPNLPGVPQSFLLPCVLGVGWVRAGIWLPAAICQPAYHRYDDCT